MSGPTKPVFVDATGKRRLIVRIIAFVAALMVVGLLAITVLSVSSDDHGNSSWTGPSNSHTFTIGASK